MSFDAIYNQMKQGFNQSWFQYFFRFTSLGRLLSNNALANPWEFFNIYENSWSITCLWFKACIQDIAASTRLDMIENSLGTLKKEDLFYEENVNVVAAHTHPDNLAGMLCFLKHRGILNSDNRNIIAVQEIPDYPTHFINDFLMLHQKGILYSETLQIVSTYRKIEEESPHARMFVNTISQMQRCILSAENRQAIVANRNPTGLACILNSLHKAGLLNAENRQTVTEHDKICELNSVLSFLGNAKILNQKNFNLVLEQDNLNKLYNAVFYLGNATILNQQNFDVVATHHNAGHLAHALVILTWRDVNFVMNGRYTQSIIIDTNDNDEYLRIKNLLPASVRNMLISKVYHDEREKVLNHIVAYLLRDTLKGLPIEVIAYMLEFVQDDTRFRIKAMEVIQNIQLPNDLDSVAVYKHDLNIQVKGFIQVKDQLSLQEQDLHKQSLWAKRNTCPEVQQAFDKQHDLSVILR